MFVLVFFSRLVGASISKGGNFSQSDGLNAGCDVDMDQII